MSDESHLVDHARPAVVPVDHVPGVPRALGRTRRSNRT